MTKPIGFIATDKRGFPICDSAGDAIVYASREDAMDADDIFIRMQSPLRVGSVLRLVRAHKPRGGTR